MHRLIAKGKKIIFKPVLLILAGAIVLLWLAGKSGESFISEEASNGFSGETGFSVELEKSEAAGEEFNRNQTTAADKVSEKPARETLGDKEVMLDAPFTPQAPFRNWKDPVQQDACEEASALMAMAWVRGEKLTPQVALEKILAISDYEEKTYGNYHDTDAEDTAERIFKGYFGYGNIEVKHGINIGDIKKELFKGKLVIVPVNGRKLGNPYYTPPGPLEHNLVIRGYDAAQKEFITNDSGIMRGENYRYKESVLEKSLQDYPTGRHEPIVEKKTAMIMVKR